MTKIRDKAKTMLTNNFSLKIIAVIIAAIVWLVVVNVNDPEKTIVIYNVPVSVTDVEVISDQNMVYEVIEGETVNVTVTGKRSVLNGLEADDFLATASLKQMSKVNAVPIEVTAKNANKRNKISIDKQSVQSLIVELENIEEDTFDIAVEYKGSTATGYSPNSYSLSETSVTVAAPTSILNRIDRVVAVCNLNGQSADFTESCKILLYDRNGNRVKGSDIQLSSKTVDVTVEVLYEKELPIVVETLGNPAEGYEVAGISYSQSTVILAGREEDLAEMNNFVINSQISIEGEAEDVVRTLNINDYLPEGITLKSESELVVTVNIAQLTEKVITLSQSDIDVNNVPEDLSVNSIKDVEVTLRGEAETIEKVTAKQLNASINLSDQEKGKVKVNVSITIPDGTELVKDVVATVVLK